MIPPRGMMVLQMEFELLLMRAIRYAMLLAVLCVGLPGLAFAHGDHAHSSTVTADHSSAIPMQFTQEVGQPVDRAATAEVGSVQHHVIASAYGSSKPCTGGCCCPVTMSCGMGACCYSSLTPTTTLLHLTSESELVSHSLVRNTALLVILGLDRPPKA